jgi:hypothetical protein
MYVVFLIVLPIAAADAIPRDRQLGVDELLETLPLSKAVYLSGKLLSLWVSVLAGLAAALLVIGLFWWFAIGPFDLGLYLEMGVLGAGTLAVLQSGLALLLSAGQPAQRRAVLVGLIVSLTGLSALIPSLQLVDPFWRNFSLSRPALFVYYVWGRMGAAMPSGYTSTTFADVWATLALGLALQAPQPELSPA